MRSSSNIPPRLQSLYDPTFERDACGFGMIVQIDDHPSRYVVDAAINALAKMRHRGGVAADGLSGDGCGLLLRRPDALLRALAQEIGITLGKLYAVGTVFLPQNGALAAKAQDILTNHLAQQDCHVLGWRTVPVDMSACGDLARATLPKIVHVFVAPNQSIDEPTFSRRLFLARKHTESALAATEGFSITSLSPESIAYKGMVLPNRLKHVFPDLQHTALSASAVIFHQRFSTNTSARWALAHPFRLIAHNGEINTIQGNRRWAQARRHIWKSPFFAISELNPLVTMDGSDSESLDNMLELLTAGGMDLLHALRIVIPPATQTLEFENADLAAFYEFHGLNLEPWDGPAGIVAMQGNYAACNLDRNGLRPARWQLTADKHFLVASEAGVWNVPEDQIMQKGKLGPGEMMAVDFQHKELLTNQEINRLNAFRAPYRRWLQQGVTYLQTELIDPSLVEEPFSAEKLRVFHILFQLSHEEKEAILRPLVEFEQEATGSMGDDTPLAVLSQKNRPLYDYFRQAFAQVTNPPIDPLREGIVMSLSTQLGKETNIFHANAQSVDHVILNSPILSQRKLRQVLAMENYVHHHRLIDLSYSKEEGLFAGLQRVCQQAAQAARSGVVLLLLSDRYPTPGKPMMHALLATGAVHHHLCDLGLRCEVNLIIETGTARDAHHMACLIGCGATAVYPYLAYQTLSEMARQGILRLGTTSEGQSQKSSEIGRRYRKGIKKGLLKIISKMGICTISSYRSGQLFEIIGLNAEVVSLCFPQTPARIGGVGFEQLDTNFQQLCQSAQDPHHPMDLGGILKYVHGGELHLYNPDVVCALQHATRTGEYADWQAYVHTAQQRPPALLRDLLELHPSAAPIPKDQVSPIADIVRHFDTAAISLGSLSPEAHEALAIAMNRLGGRSNSGEGGEDPARYGTEKRSRIKQIASGRFGVTPHFLVNADVLQIKMAQGAKPGEGGQLPGHKVNETIARLRCARPGIGLISPPPHHDIYSIEDLAQLIYDLKEVNPHAQISVKLVAHHGVGTIATGVAKAGANLITISGHDGGTGASPLSSIRHTGVSWELGLAEAHHALVYNGLRDQVILQTDGGLKTGLDVVKAAILGAQSFAFGTAPLIVLGCKYLRICHLNNCATGIATQDARLRQHFFKGLPERVIHFFTLLAEEVREHLAMLGANSLDDIVGRTALLRPLETRLRHGITVDVSMLLQPAIGLTTAERKQHTHPSSTLAEQLDRTVYPAIVQNNASEYHFSITNVDRAIGARLSGHIARLYGHQGISHSPINITFKGTAGQSFGAFNAPGLHIILEGEANDYVGKSMAGGRIVVFPSQNARCEARKTPIVGNTCLYGATGGEFYAAGRAGERFAVRNSGATAVIEGAGDHCCEYMTDGIVLVLGKVGLNFGAGFTGGFAYVLDIERDFVDCYNHELIDIHRISPEGFEQYRQHLRQLLLSHHSYTQSIWAHQILEDFRYYIGKFWLVKPKAASLQSLTDTLGRAA